MTALIDTCSCVALSKYYLEFDKSGKLLDFIHNKFLSHEILMLDAVMAECRSTSQGLTLKKLPFLKDFTPVDTTQLTPRAPSKFSNIVDNQFRIPLKTKNMNAAQYEAIKSNFIQSADAKLIIYAYNSKVPGILNLDETVIITEETKTQNDGKPFAKIPSCCEIIKVRSMTIVDYLKENHVKIDYKNLPQ